MTTKSYTSDSLRAEIAQTLAAKYPRASAKRRGELSEKIVAHAGCGLESFTLDDWVLGQHIDYLTGQHPELLLSVPTNEAVYTALEKRHAAKLREDYPDNPAKQVVDPTWKLKTFHEVQSLDEDARFAVVPAGKSEPPELPQPAAPKAKDSVEALDAEVERRWGKKPHELMATDRRRFHDLLRNEQHRAASAEYNRKVALVSVDGDFDKLPPAERIARHRAAEKAKQANRG